MHSIAVLGLDPFRDAAALKVRIGVQLQEAQLQKRITVREAVDFWASLYTPAYLGPRPSAPFPQAQEVGGVAQTSGK